MERYELDRAWRNDYDRVRISPEDRSLVKKIKQELRTELLPHLKKFFSDFEVHFIKKDRSHCVGMYIDGSYKKPIILLNLELIKKTCEKYDVRKDCTVETTIVHELGHAIEDWYEVCTNEDEVEEFAREWYWSRQLYEFWDGFEAPEIFNEERLITIGEE